VPLAAIQVVSAQQADVLGEHGVTDIDGLVNTSVDDLVEFLDVSLDEAEKILAAARSVIEIRERSQQPATEEGGESEAAAPDVEAEAAVSTQPEASAPDTESEDSTAEGYDQAVKNGIPFSAESNIRAEFSADPVALTEADPMTVDELVLQDAGRDLRPDVITPAPDLMSVPLGDLEADEVAEEFAAPAAGEAGIAESTASETSSALESSPDEKAATDESLKGEKQ
jgi:hypothetical protein